MTPHIKSFVRREGRITPSQRRALEVLWPRYGIDYAASLTDFSQIFGRSAELVLEIGFGNGESLLEMAKAAPEKNFIGIEVHRPGLGTLLSGIEREGLKNLRIIRHDAVDVLSHMVADNALNKVQIFFPDPWHKKRHHKRRLIQTDFIDLLARKLVPNGFLHLATDWENYAEQMMLLISASKAFENTVGKGEFYQNAYDLRPMTKFERRGLRLNHRVLDLLFVKLA